MDKVKIKNVNSGAIEEVKREIAGDFIGTKEWVMAEDKDNKKEPVFNKEEK